MQSTVRTQRVINQSQRMRGEYEGGERQSHAKWLMEHMGPRSTSGRNKLPPPGLWEGAARQSHKMKTHPGEGWRKNQKTFPFLQICILLTQQLLLDCCSGALPGAAICAGLWGVFRAAAPRLVHGDKLRAGPGPARGAPPSLSAGTTARECRYSLMETGVGVSAEPWSH